jgi:Tfp pilus assembly protein PilV
MIELLVAVIILSIGATSLLTAVNASVANQSYSQRRASILASVQNTVDKARSTATGGTIITGTTTQTLTVSGIQGSVTLTKTCNLVAGYTDLYTVDVKATWTEIPGLNLTRADSLDLTTLIRSNDT